MKCLVCGKEFYVPYPDIWVYKRGQHYICSWKCLRAYDKRPRSEQEVKLGEKKRDRVSIGKELVEIIEQDGDPLKKLKELGYARPIQAYRDIRAALVLADPELGAKMPMRRKSWWMDGMTEKEEAALRKAERANKPGRKTNNAIFIDRKKVDVGMPKAGEAMELKLEGGQDYEVSVAETPEDPKPAPEKKITKPVNFGGYDVTAIRHPLYGEMYHDRKYNTIDWRTPEGEEVSMSPEDWIRFGMCIPDMLGVLGVQI